MRQDLTGEGAGARRRRRDRKLVDDRAETVVLVALAHKYSEDQGAAAVHRDRSPVDTVDVPQT